MFDEEFELQAFPFDNQDCTVSVLLHTRAFRLTYRRNPTRESTFEESKVMLTEVCPRPLASGQPASLTARWLMQWDTQPPEDEQIDDPKQNHYNVYIRLKRRPKYYATHVMVPIGLFSFMTWLAYTLPAEESGDRLSVGLTLMLTLVAFKFSVTSDLPRLPYATHLDNYIFLNLVMQIIIIVHIGITGYTRRKELAGLGEAWGCGADCDEQFAMTTFFIACAIQLSCKSRRYF